MVVVVVVLQGGSEDLVIENNIRVKYVGKYVSRY